MAGFVHDLTGSYDLAFILAIACCAVSAVAIWIAAPRKVRLVPGRVPGAAREVGNDPKSRNLEFDSKDRSEPDRQAT